MRILISTPFLGGSGGIERNVSSTLACLSERHEVDVYATNIATTGYVVPPGQARVLPRELPGRRRRRRRERYDAYLHYQHATDVQDAFPVGARMVIPSGDDVRHLEARFDAVLLQAPDNDRHLEDKSKAVLLPPPLNVPAERSEPVEGVPDEFFLTVFNPYHPRKGLGDLRDVAPRSPLPFVWCRAGRFAAEHPADGLDGVVVLEDLSQAQLRFLYERCRAYVSFDHHAGFGWSLADGLQYGSPTLARDVGVMSLPDIDRSRSWVFSSNEELVDLLQRNDFEHTTRDLGDLSPQRFVERFEALVRVLEVMRPREPAAVRG